MPQLLEVGRQPIDRSVIHLAVGSKTAGGSLAVFGATGLLSVCSLVRGEWHALLRCALEDNVTVARRILSLSATVLLLDEGRLWAAVLAVFKASAPLVVAEAIKLLSQLCLLRVVGALFDLLALETVDERDDLCNGLAGCPTFDLEDVLRDRRADLGEHLLIDAAPIIGLDLPENGEPVGEDCHCLQYLLHCAYHKVQALVLCEEVDSVVLPAEVEGGDGHEERTSGPVDDWAVCALRDVDKDLHIRLYVGEALADALEIVHASFAVHSCG